MPEIAKKARLIQRVVVSLEHEVEKDCDGAREKAIDYQRQREPCEPLFQAPPIKQTVQGCSNRKDQEILLAGYRAGQAKACCDAAQSKAKRRLVFESWIKEIERCYGQGCGHGVAVAGKRVN
ncbi:MAG: hypothetical protein ACRD3W_28495, partial [Terriglobales bacterium]